MQANTCRSNALQFSRIDIALQEVVNWMFLVRQKSPYTEPSICWCKGLKISNISNPFVQTCCASHFIRGRLSPMNNFPVEQGRKGVMRCCLRRRLETPPHWSHLETPTIMVTFATDQTSNWSPLFESPKKLLGIGNNALVQDWARDWWADRAGYSEVIHII